MSISQEIRIPAPMDLASALIVVVGLIVLKHIASGALASFLRPPRCQGPMTIPPHKFTSLTLMAILEVLNFIEYYTGMIILQIPKQYVENEYLT